MIETDKDKDFYKRLIIRLIRNEIAITDTLSPALDYHMYPEILGNGQVMTFSQTVMSKNYYYNLIDILGENVTTIGFLCNYNGKIVSSNDTEKNNYLHSINVEMHLPYGTRRPNATSSTTNVTKEQWNMMMKPFLELCENVLKSFDYLELIMLES